MMKKTVIQALLALALVMPSMPAFSQNQPVPTSPQMPPVSVVNLQIVKNKDGSQSVITPKGDLAVLPGAGVKGNVAQIYFGTQGGFWYIDKKGTTVDLVPTVQALQARRERAAQQGQQAPQVPQYAPMAYEDQMQYQQQGTDPGTYEDGPEQSSDDDDGKRGGRVRNAVSTVGTAAAAGVGAAAGAAMSNNYYRAPYGTPMYYGNGARPYYYDHGDRRELDDLNQNQKVAIHNKRTIDKQNQQKAVSQAQAHRSESGGTRQNFEQQSSWYQSERQSNPSKFQKHSGENPFAASGGGGRSERAASRSSGGGFQRSGGGGGGRARGGGGGRRR